MFHGCHCMHKMWRRSVVRENSVKIQSVETQTLYVSVVVCMVIQYLRSLTHRIRTYTHYTFACMHVHFSMFFLFLFCLFTSTTKHRRRAQETVVHFNLNWLWKKSLPTANDYHKHTIIEQMRAGKCVSVSEWNVQICWEDTTLRWKWNQYFSFFNQIWAHVL